MALSLPSERRSGGELILVIDDEELTRMFVRQTLEAAGFAVAEAEDGDAGLAISGELNPDLIMLDVLMPGRDGFEVCTALRQLTQHVETPVLIMTGLEDADSVDRAYQVGATDFITKPIRWDLLPHRIRYILRATRTMEALAASQTKLVEAQRIAGLTTWEWDIEKGLVSWTDAAFHELGLAE